VRAPRPAWAAALRLWPCGARVLPGVDCRPAPLHWWARLLRAGREAGGLAGGQGRAGPPYASLIFSMFHHLWARFLAISIGLSLLSLQMDDFLV